MKIGKLIAVFVFLLISANINAEGLAKERIGPLTAGVHIFELASFDTNARVDRVQQEETFYLEYTFSIPKVGEVKALLEHDDATVYWLSTSSSALTTSRGARVGMSLKTLKEIYPHGKLTPAWDSGESEFNFILPEDEGVFVFNGRQVIEECGDKYPNCEVHLLDKPSEKFYTF